MKLKDLKVLIVNDYEVKDNKPQFKSLDEKINEVFKRYPEKSLVDIKILNKKTAMIIYSD